MSALQNGISLVANRLQISEEDAAALICESEIYANGSNVDDVVIGICAAGPAGARKFIADLSAGAKKVQLPSGIFAVVTGKTGYEFRLGGEDGFDGIRFWVADEEAERELRSAYLLADSEFERRCNKLCDAGRAEYRG